MPIISFEVAGLEGLVTKVLQISHLISKDSFLWFRGIANDQHKLLPSMMRAGKGIEEIYERERRLLTRFRQRSLAYWPEGYPQNDWEHLFAMQHFGIPTRLLDWSENLFVATHFALLRSPDDAAHSPVIWCVDPIAWNRSTPVLSEYGDSIHVLTTSDDELEAYRPETTKRRNKSPVAMFGTHNSRRIVAQRGTFMVWGSDPRCLEDFADESGGILWKLQIKGERWALSQDLASLGFGETMVFPELSALATELSRTEGWRA